MPVGERGPPRLTARRQHADQSHSVTRVHFTEYHVRLASYALITDRADQVLLTWFNGAGGLAPCWTMPGGGVGFDESLTQAVEREVHEETGYQVETGPLIAEHHKTFPALTGRVPVRSQRFVFAAEITGGQLGTIESEGTTDFARWVPLKEAQEIEPAADIIAIALAELGR